MRKVLITGGNKGIGLETTKLFLEAGYQVIVVARDFNNFPYKTNSNIQTIEFDLNKVCEIAVIRNIIGAVDVLVNNAGIMYSLPYDDYPEENKERLMNVNLYAPIEFITQFYKLMIKNGGGRIINVASVAGQIGHPDIWYGISKAGILNATKSFAKILAKDGITVNAVAPGPTLTDMMQVIPEARKSAIKANTYSNRFASAEEIAKTIFWLGTDAPEYINGFCIDLNNGAFPR